MRRNLALVGAAGLALALTPLTAEAAPGDATVSVLHAVPGLTVDVYANGEEVIPNFEPGTLSEPLMLPAGSYDLQVFADGEEPGSAEPAIEANDVEVPAGANATVVAHLGENGDPMLTPFVNDTSQTAPGNARLTVRHTAAAPAVDVRAGGDVLAEGLTNPNEAALEVPAGTYSADVVLAGTDNVVIGPADVQLGEGTNTIVYAWGSAQDGNLQLAVQTIEGLHSAPGGVPGGEAGLAPESQPQSLPLWALGLGALSAGALAVAGRRLAPAARARR